MAGFSLPAGWPALLLHLPEYSGAVFLPAKKSMWMALFHSFILHLSSPLLRSVHRKKLKPAQCEYEWQDIFVPVLP